MIVFGYCFSALEHFLPKELVTGTFFPSVFPLESYKFGHPKISLEFSPMDY